ncbi:MAG: ion transporter [Gemmatimonadota bacterium]
MAAHEGDPAPAGEERWLDAERRQALEELEDWLERPLVALGVVWLGLLVVELVRGLSPALEVLGTVIWVVFLGDFALRLTLAPDRSRYVRRNWLTALSLVVPALRVLRFARVLRVARVARAGRGLRLVRLVSSVNRGMRALRASLSRRKFAYVILLTLLVTVVGAAGMYAFERESANGFRDFESALWWTAMVMTTLGSESWPRTGAGRLLCLGLAIYAFAVFGYTTATLATFFVGRDAEDERGELAGSRELEAVRSELARLREEIRAGRTGGPV